MLLWLMACTPGRQAEPEDLAGPGPGKDGGVRDLTVQDLTAVPPIAFIDLDTIRQNCMPIVMPDPLMVIGRLTIRNQAATPLGPITAGEVAVFNRNDAQIATFRLREPNLGMVAGSGEEVKRIEKAPGSLMPQNGCRTLPCGEAARIEIPLSGPGVAAGSRAKSAPYVVECTM
jgi:hypothetical protein